MCVVAAHNFRYKLCRAICPIMNFSIGQAFLKLPKNYAPFEIVWQCGSHCVSIKSCFFWVVHGDFKVAMSCHARKTKSTHSQNYANSCKYNHKIKPDQQLKMSCGGPCGLLAYVFMKSGWEKKNMCACET